MNVTMGEDKQTLQEVVVVGYGVQKKESLTGAVTVIDSKAFQEKGGLSSPLQALQGQVPGVMISRSSSAPGDESWGLNLRGASSMNSTEPLVVIDGVAANSVSEMRLLNPDDIESINFLKDGSAAIYGSRAAGGVVLITTKKGKEGKLQINYSGSATLKTVGLMPELCNIDQWAEGVQTALRNDKSSYRISGSFLYDGSTLQYGNNNNKRYNIRWNNTNKLNKIFTLESSIAYSRQEQVAPTLVGAALTTNMPMPGLPLTAHDGQPYAWGTWGSPVAKTQYGWRQQAVCSLA